MEHNKKIYIYFDTNCLECRHSKKSLYLSTIKFSNIYYFVEQLINKLSLSDKVQICIPEIVILEIKEHLVSHFKSEKDSLKEKIKSSKKSFGDLIELTYTFKDCNNVDEYKQYLEKKFDDYFNDPKFNAKMVEYPKDDNFFTKIIQQAIQSNKPFHTARCNNKTYTDAGLKDAIIYYTIIEHTKENIGILISKDKDFEKLFSDIDFHNIFLCVDEEEVENKLCEILDIPTNEILESKIREDSYLIGLILNECDFDDSVEYNFVKIIDFYQSEKEDTFDINFIMWVEREKYIFNIRYNNVANELIYASYEAYEEGMKND